MSVEQLLRLRLLTDIISRMSDEDKRVFLHFPDKSVPGEDMARFMRQQAAVLDAIHQKVSRQTWWSDFSSNIAGNAVWDSLLWIGGRLIRKL